MNSNDITSCEKRRISRVFLNGGRVGGLTRLIPSHLHFLFLRRNVGYTRHSPQIANGWPIPAGETRGWPACDEPVAPSNPPPWLPSVSTAREPGPPATRVPDSVVLSLPLCAIACFGFRTILPVSGLAGSPATRGQRSAPLNSSVQSFGWSPGLTQECVAWPRRTTLAKRR